MLEEEPAIVEEEGGGEGGAGAGGAWTHGPAYIELLKTWARRTPSVAHHSTAAWDDLICSRLRMLAAMKAAVRRAVGEQR